MHKLFVGWVKVVGDLFMFGGISDCLYAGAQGLGLWFVDKKAGFKRFLRLFITSFFHEIISIFKGVGGRFFQIFHTPNNKELINLNFINV